MMSLQKHVGKTGNVAVEEQTEEAKKTCCVIWIHLWSRQKGKYTHDQLVCAYY